MPAVSCYLLLRNRGVWGPPVVPRPARSGPGHAWRADKKNQKMPVDVSTSDAIGARRRESYIHEYFKPKLRHGVRLELLDVLVEQEWPGAVLLVALETWSGADLDAKFQKGAPLVQSDARRRRRLEEL